MAPKARGKATAKAAQLKASEATPEEPQAETRYNLRKRERPDPGHEAQAGEGSTAKKKKPAPPKKARGQKAPRPTAATSKKPATTPEASTKAKSGKTEGKSTHTPTPTKSQSKGNDCSPQSGREIEGVLADATNKAGSTSQIQPKQKIPGIATSFRAFDASLAARGTKSSLAVVLKVAASNINAGRHDSVVFHADGTPQSPSVRKHSCTSCYDTKAQEDFPYLRPGLSHNHPIETCRECLQAWIATRVSEKIVQIGCPECDEHLSRGVVEAVAEKRVFDQLCEQESLNFIRTMEGFISCPNADCSGGHQHPHPEEEPIFTCEVCNAKYCTLCKVPYHDGLTCAEYKQRGGLTEEQKGQEDATAKFKEKRTKKCPDCRSPIQKDRGCDHMTCSYCRKQFCWDCLADWNSIIRNDNSRHNPTCRWYRGNLPSAPQVLSDTESEDDDDDDDDDEDEDEVMFGNGGGDESLYD
ncbi:hypothetical protein BU16DRAFT_556011 [Lophium mytilinum]|uniref:RBR-type E3 ubiquitin transferase n=1 Tax=Lophium mytilinum TaxID=390894 RepID=A0A6A6RCR6_9PEZI|nr:hypothetical protein BU16DRAFT_556011 [Lophium mytilinum]